MSAMKLSAYKNLYLFSILLLCSCLITFLVVKISIVVAVLVIALTIGVPILYLMLTDVKTGFSIFIIYSFLLFLISRISPVPLPSGILIDVFIGVMLAGVFLRPKVESKKDWARLKNPLSFIILGILLFDLLQAVNPNAHSILAWLDGMRETMYLIFTYIVASHVFNSYDYIKKFSALWITLALSAALWSIRQEITGFWAHEWAHIYRQPDMYKLIYQWGHFRKFSFLSDVSSAGMTMAFAGLFCFVVFLRTKESGKRIRYLVMLVFMLLAMNYSGTRTATAMFVVGVAFYSLLTMTNWKTLIVGFLAFLTFIIIIFGPFYGPRIHRIRSTFFPSEDNSMGVRDYNRIRIQPYIRSHPIGGGINTADIPGLKFSPSHQLAGLPTDSGYLTVAVERGYIGLILILIFYGYVMILGIVNFYRARSSEVKMYYAAYLTSFFSLTIGNFTQSAMDQKPLFMITIGLFVIIIRLIDFDEIVYRLEQKKKQTQYQ